MRTSVFPSVAIDLEIEDTRQGVLALESASILSDLVFCRTEDGGGHLVLHVYGWILDNRHKWVMRQDDLPYEWVKIGKPDGRWWLVKTTERNPK